MTTIKDYRTEGFDYSKMNLKTREKTAWDASYVYGQYNADYESRVDMNRLRKDRLAKLQAAMVEDKVGTMLLYNQYFIRYAVGSRWLTLLQADKFFRHAVVPCQGEPILFEVAGVEQEHREMTADWLAGRIRPAIIWQYSGPAQDAQVNRWADNFVATLKELGTYGEPVGADRIDVPSMLALQARGVNLVDAWNTIAKALATKTDDELELLKTACTIADAGYYRAKQEMRPGMRENQLYGKVCETLFDLGADHAGGMVIASGGHTNPYLRDFTDKIMRCGDLVIIDMWPAYMGYHADYCRTFVLGKATQEQKDLFKQCKEWLDAAMGVIKPGVTTAEVAEQFPVYADDQFGTLSMVQFAHGTGVSVHEPPAITRGYSLKYPAVIQEGMFMGLETYAGKPNGVQGVRLEQNFVVTKNGIEVFTLFPWEEELMS